MSATLVKGTPQPKWKQIGLFLGLTFGLTFLLDLMLYLTVGYKAHAGTTMWLQVQMMIPAAVAIALQVFVFRDSAIYRLRDGTRWFFYAYLGFTLLYALLALSALFTDNLIVHSILTGVGLLLCVGMLVLIVVVRVVAGKEAVARSGLAGGRVWQYATYGIGLVAIYGLMTALNYVFGLGQAVDVNELMRQAAGGQSTPLDQLPGPVLLLIGVIQNVLLAPLLGLAIAFGEEYGWRGYLQGELIRLGKVRGILLLGVIWGLWHAPIIMMGHNFPGHPVAGVFAMTGYTIGLGFFLGYAVLKTGSVWLAAYLHALNNGVAGFFMAMVYAPKDALFSFAPGLYGLAVWALIVAGMVLLDRKAWLSPAGAVSEIGTEPEH